MICLDDTKRLWLYYFTGSVRDCIRREAAILRGTLFLGCVRADAISAENL